MEKIGPYQIIGVLHEGPRRLYRVRGADGRLLALKAIAVEGTTPETRERFNREAAICKELDHPNLVRVYDSGEADGFLYQTMDLLEGADLGKVLAERRPLSWEQRLSYMQQTCEGLEYAHVRNLIHRDIKPSNLFIENSGRLRILDFGMARIQSSALTRAGMAVGTINYMAPEQIRGEACSAATDVFAAGIVFYELATGKHPFASRGMAIADILTGVLFQAPPPLKDSAPNAPEGLDLVLNKALEKDVGQRLQNAGDFKQALSICQITLRLRPSGAGEQTKTRTAAAPGPIEIPEALWPENVGDPGKTIAVSRPAKPVAAPAPSELVRPSEPPAPPRAAPPRDLIFCPACTQGNPKGATSCAHCGQLLVAPRLLPEAESEDRRLQWFAIAIITLGVLLLLYLIIGGVLK